MQYDIDFWWRIDIHRITNYIRLLSTLSNTGLTSKFFKTGFNRLYLVVCANNTMLQFPMSNSDVFESLIITSLRESFAWDAKSLFIINHPPSRWPIHFPRVILIYWPKLSRLFIWMKSCIIYFMEMWIKVTIFEKKTLCNIFYLYNII